MSESQPEHEHSAQAAALGFYYQTFYALLMLLEQDTDHAAIGVEQLDDVVLSVNGQTLLVQLKHSMSASPAPVTVKSASLWRTIKIWIDSLPYVSLSETWFHLVAVGGVGAGDPLEAVLSADADRTALHAAMVSEAQRVVTAHTLAQANNQTSLPHAKRIAACKAFLSIDAATQLNILRRTRIKKHSPAITEIDGLVADQLRILPATQRPLVARRLMEWWDVQMVYSLCGKRSAVVSRAELQHTISTLISDIEQEKLLPDFESLSPPADYQPHGLLARQIALVNGTSSDHNKAIREEWRAREQRARWINDRLSMASVINQYDEVLKEHWSDRHSRVVEECAALDANEKCSAGLKVLRWSHDEAPGEVRPIGEGWSAPYYVRGSYQVLAINLQVGWHPNFAALIGEDK